jgi:hypothetical protein
MQQAAALATKQTGEAPVPVQGPPAFTAAEPRFRDFLLTRSSPEVADRVTLQAREIMAAAVEKFRPKD